MPEIKKLDLNDADIRSADIVAENIASLKALFPDAFEAGKIDFEVLKALLGSEVDDKEEKYGLNWHGKRRARQIALTPSTGTLLPSEGESVDWDTTRNLMIEGDNLEVLKLLQKSYAGKVKLIFIDPPYNTGGDFIYPDDFEDNLRSYLELTGQTEEGRPLTSNMEASGRFHTDWLQMMFPRLRLARQLLSDDGALFVTIDDNEAPRLRLLMDEIFGEENFVANIVWNHTKQSKNDELYFSRQHNQVFVYRRSPGLKRLRFERVDKDNANYANPDGDPRGDWRPGDVRSPSLRDTLRFNIVTPSGNIIEPPDNGWRWSETAITEKIASGEIVFSKDEKRIVRKIYLDDQDGRTPENLWLAEFAGTTRGATSMLKDMFGEAPFDTPKPIELVQKAISLVADGDDDIIMDFFAGSGTTGHAVMAQNSADGGSRRFVLVQLPEPISADDKDQKVAATLCDTLGKPRNIAELTKERIRRAGAGIKSANPLFKGDVGFRVLKLGHSNIRAWTATLSDIEGTLLANAEHLVQGRTEQDVLYELLLKLGLDLCVPIETKKIDGKTTYAVGGGALIVCLADGLTKDVVEKLALGIVAWREELAPAVDTRVVFKDSGFADDVAKTNMAAILNQNGIADIRSL